MSNPDPFDTWVPRDYLRDYFNEVQEDERHAIRYFVEQVRAASPGPVLCFGCGPTLHHVFLTLPCATDLVLGDYLPRNLDEIREWCDEAPGAHDWTPFVRYTLYCESGVDPSPDEIAARMKALRGAISGLVHADARLADPLGPSFRGSFQTVLSPFCADSATDDKETWRLYCRNIASLVRPGGTFLTSALRACRGYKVGGRTFPSANVDEADMHAILEKDFQLDSVQVEVRSVPEHMAQGYAGILLARASKAR